MNKILNIKLTGTQVNTIREALKEFNNCVIGNTHIENIKEIQNKIDTLNYEFDNSSWISVNDRLPEKDAEILVYTSDKEIEQVTFTFGIYFTSAIKNIENVTHWMPRPNPPTGDKL